MCIIRSKLRFLILFSLSLERRGRGVVLLPHAVSYLRLACEVMPAVNQSQITFFNTILERRGRGVLLPHAVSYLRLACEVVPAVNESQTTSFNTILDARSWSSPPSTCCVILKIGVRSDAQSASRAIADIVV
jgi:hypothetical protein